MKKLNSVLLGLMAAAVLMLFAQCNNTKSEPAKAVPAASTGLKIAYIEIDSLTTQYQFCKDYSLLLQKKSENARTTLNQKGKNLESEVADFQRKVQNNGYATQERAQQEQNRLMKMQQDLQDLQNRLAAELDNETIKWNNALRDSIQNFLKEYNAEKGYNVVFSKAGDNMLLADPALDITEEVVSALNARYVPSKELEGEGK